MDDCQTRIQSISLCQAATLAIAHRTSPQHRTRKCYQPAITHMEILTTPKNYKYAKEGMTEKSGGVGWGGWGSKDYSNKSRM